MKVEDSQKILSTTLGPKQTETQQGPAEQRPAGGREDSVSSVPARVELSEQSKGAQKAADVARKTPEVRWEKVEALREKIAAGEYHVDPQDVADKIVKHLLSELIR